MTSIEWLTLAHRHQPSLEALLAAWHPAGPAQGIGFPRLPITAPSAEAACIDVRQQIRETHEGDPVTEFRAALAAGDCVRVANLLNEAWFGVPESTACWQIEGFRHAVDLLDDLPEDVEGRS